MSIAFVRRKVWFFSFLALLLLQGVGPIAAETTVDLTHRFDANTIYWPTEPGFVLQKGPAGVTERGYFYAANRFTTPEHGGTHIDAPIHFFDTGQTVDEIPLSRLMGEGVCVDVSLQCAADRDYLVTVEDLQTWERDHEASLTDKIVLINTGYARRWPNRTEYLGTSATGREAVSQLHFPGLDPQRSDVAGDAPQDPASRHRYRQHRPRPVARLCCSCESLPSRRPRAGKPRQARPSSTTRFSPHCFADEDRRRHRRSVPRGGGSCGVGQITRPLSITRARHMRRSIAPLLVAVFARWQRFGEQASRPGLGQVRGADLGVEVVFETNDFAFS